MAKTLENYINEILEHNVSYDMVYSVFDKWLTEGECENVLMSVYDVKSFTDYTIVKEIEYNYLKLINELNTAFQLVYVDIDSLEIQKDLNFSFLVREVSKHLMQDEEKLFLVPTEEVGIMLSRDFNIYIYSGNKLRSTLNDMFFKHHFYSLSI